MPTDRQRLDFCIKNPLIGFVLFGRKSIMDSGHEPLIMGVLGKENNIRRAVDAVMERDGEQIA